MAAIMQHGIVVIRSSTCHDSVGLYPCDGPIRLCTTQSWNDVIVPRLPLRISLRQYVSNSKQVYGGCQTMSRIVVSCLERLNACVAVGSPGAVIIALELPQCVESLTA